MDKIRKFIPEDYAQICDWFMARDIPCPKMSHLPQTGYICDGVAAGFIYLTDSAICIIDTFISNPSSDDKKRDRALNLITMHLIEFAKSALCEVIVCSTSSHAVAVRAKNFGFNKVKDETCYARSL